MKRPALEVADIIRSAGKGFIERNRPHLGWQQLKVLHGSARRSSRSVFPMRPSRHLLLLLSEPALPKMPDQRPQQVARGSLR